MDKSWKKKKKKKPKPVYTLRTFEKFLYLVRHLNIDKRVYML